MSSAALRLSQVPVRSIRKILFATDFSAASSAVQPVVSALAKQHGAEVYVVHVATPKSRHEGMRLVEPASSIDIEASMKDLVASFPRTVPVKGFVEWGTPARELKRLAELRRIDLAIVGTHGRTGLKHLTMGSTAEELLRS